MVNVVNVTPAKHAFVPMKDKTGRENLVLIVKYTFAVDAAGRVSLVTDDSAPYPSMGDSYNGEDGATASIRKPSDLYDYKPGTDVLLIGHAHPLWGARPPDHVDVRLQVGPVDKRVRAHGLRVWRAALRGGVIAGPARPITEPVPLIYELAWGGMDLSDPEHMVGDPRNYVGRGVASDPARLVDQPAAQLEDPDHPIGSHHVVPACFGAIHRHWVPRMSFAGTYDAAWEATKMPLLPDDFDARHHVSVPHDQWSPRPLRGDEPVRVTGVSPDGLWQFQLPRVEPRFVTWIEGQRQEHLGHLDTFLIDADERRVELTWRASAPMPRKYEMVERALIYEKRVVQL
ncbi:MAG: DUF2169 domain-containing protein [Myxococcales bacterium]|nr:DUF2169 domain-containing protein [Myxococcales bacterium]